MSDHLTADLGRHSFGESDFETLLYHTGNASAPLARWRQRIQQASLRGWEEVQKHAGEVMQLVAEPKVLFTAAAELRAGGPKAPGHNELRLENLTGNELWPMCETLGKAIASDMYRPGRELVVWVRKASGSGKRPIVLIDVQDRVVQKAAALVLRMMLDMRFDTLSFAFRQGRSRAHGIAVAELLAGTHPVWLTHDLKDAFGRVPLGRLLDAVFKILPCPRLRAFLSRVLPPRSRSLGGIKQGGPLSPLMLEFYLTRFVHEPWRQSGHPVRILRFADDMLLEAQDMKAAKIADTALRELLTPTGMLLKATFEDAVRDVRKNPAEWLGLQFRLAGGKFQVRLGEHAFGKLGRRFLVAHAKGRPAKRAGEVLRHWVAQLGPCHRWEDRGEVYRRAFEAAVAHGFEELPAEGELEELWEGAAERWGRTRKYVRKNLAFLPEGPLVPPTPTSVIW